jgi:hypothetical protein
LDEQTNFCFRTFVQPYQRQRITSGASVVAKRRLVHAMLDGVFEPRNKFLDVRRQRATTLDVWPQRDRWGKNHGAVQADRIKIVVEIWSPTAMKRVAGPPHAGPAVFPVTCPSDVGAPLVGEKHVGAPIGSGRAPASVARS